MNNYTNKYGWPEELVKSILKDRYTNPDEDEYDFSISRIVAPIQQTVLLARYPEKKKVKDVSELFWAFMGHLAHNLVEEQNKEIAGVRCEERLYIEVEGVKVSGKFDRYEDGQIKDYKTTKCYKIIKGDYADWAAQQNCYRLILEENGLPVNSIKITAILFDWAEHESYKKNYPKSQVLEIPIQVWGAGCQRVINQIQSQAHKISLKCKPQLEF